MTKDLIKTLRRLQKTFIEVRDDTGLNDLEMYVKGLCTGLDIAIQEIESDDSEKIYIGSTTSAPESWKVYPDKNPEQDPKSSGKEILEYLKSKTVKTKSSTEFKALTDMIDKKTDWEWRQNIYPVKPNTWGFSTDIILSTNWKEPEKLSFSEAFNLLSQLPDKNPEQDCTDKCAENAQACTDLTETPEKTSGESAEESSASLPEDCTGPLKFNPYKESNTPEEIREYLSTVSVEILDSESFDSLMSMLEKKIDSMWGPSSSPTDHKGRWYMLPDALSIYPEISFIHKARIISFSVAMDLLKRLPDKD